MQRSKRQSYACSFCRKGQEQVLRLIAGPGGVFICDECVAAFQNENKGNLGREPRYDGVHCSFCGKIREKVSFLVEGPHKIYICDECLDLCREIIDEQQRLH